MIYDFTSPETERIKIQVTVMEVLLDWKKNEPNFTMKHHTAYKIAAQVADKLEGMKL